MCRSHRDQREPNVHFSSRSNIRLDFGATASVAVTTPDTCFGRHSVAGPAQGRSANRETNMTKQKTKTPRKTKTALVRELLERPGGAALDELCKATGWQAHTVRAALSGLRKTGCVIHRETDDAGTSLYRITGSKEAAQ